MTNEELWQSVLAQVQLNISPANFATWFKSTKIVSVDEGKALISVPNSFAKEWLENKYNRTIFKILYSLNPEVKELKYTVEKSPLKVVKPVRPQEDEAQLEFQEFRVNKDTNLNPRYTFDNFIIGPFNELPHAAASAVAENPGSVYNPLFVYGGVGLGKTHLLQAVGNEVIKNFPDKKVKYFPAEKFISTVVSSIKNHKMEEFKSSVRDVDVLIIDDVQFLSGKEKTQEEFFHLFNALYEKNKQVVLSSDRSPKSIPALTERLRSRFEGGMIADISYPDYETRIAILKNKCQERGTSFPEDVLDYLASNIKRNIRELEGALNKLSIYQKMNNRIPEIGTIESLFKNVIASSQKVTTPKKIIEAVAEFYDIKEKDLISSSRKKEIVKPRQVVMYLLKEELKASFPFIGRRLGGKDHTTAIYAYEKISNEIKTDENLESEINIIKQRILSA